MFSIIFLIYEAGSDYYFHTWCLSIRPIVLRTSRISQSNNLKWE